jgi:hypothetical protein
MRRRYASFLERSWQPGAVVEAGKGRGNGADRGPSKARVSCWLSGGYVGSTRGARGGTTAYLLMGFPVGFLVVARAVKRDQALRVVLQSHFGRRLFLATGTVLGHL